MDYKLKKLDNGLRILTVPLPNLESAAITLWIGVGSRFEKDKSAGISHFLEHIVFKGSKKFPSAKKVSYALDSIGAEANAATSHEWTNFYVKSASTQVERAFEILADITLNPLLRKEDIEKEKGVILEEIAMHKDNPMDKIGGIFMSLAFAGNPLGKDITGTPKSVKNLKRSDFEMYRDSHYRADNMVLTAAGKIDVDKIEKLALGYFGGLKKGIKKRTKKFILRKKGPKIKLEFKKTEQMHIILGFYGYNRTHKDRYAEGVLSVILGRGMSSRLFSEIREKKGLAYAVNTSVFRFVDTGVFSTYAGINPENIGEVIKIILDQSYGIANGKYPVRKKELDKAKEFIKGRTALSLEDTTEVNEFFGKEALFLPEIDTPEEFFRKVDSVSFEDVEKVARDIFMPEKLNLAVIGPYKDKSEFEKLVK